MVNENNQGNPFVTPFNVPGMGTFNIPAPIYDASGGYNPAIGNAAKSYAKPAMNTVIDFMSKRGLADSSIAGAGLERAFRGGFNQASQDYLGQQQLYNQLSMAQMGMLGNIPPAPSNFAQDPIGSITKGLFGADTGLGSLLGVGENNILGLDFKLF